MKTYYLVNVKNNHPVISMCGYDIKYYFAKNSKLFFKRRDNVIKESGSTIEQMEELVKNGEATAIPDYEFVLMFGEL